MRLPLGIVITGMLLSLVGNVQADADPHRPACTSPRCRKIKTFLKANYCGQSPAGNGPADGCEIHVPKKRRNVKVTAALDCKWVDGVRNCQQRGQPSSQLRSILVGKLRRLGLPAKATRQVYFTIWKPIGLDWTLVEAYYEHLAESDVALCEVIAIIDSNSHVSVIRKVPFQDTDADKNTVTTWSPLDLFDVNADGKIEVILEGDAYEDHWIEVAGKEGGSFRTIFSGLGYFL